jgi:hypothetical protein
MGGEWKTVGVLEKGRNSRCVASQLPRASFAESDTMYL